ncbi:MAG TPA: DUF2147 domain-containing protein [Burkholderiales bacterium]|nr:DUF2147 domain-containing protein [Burkholderiales bacterium]
MKGFVFLLLMARIAFAASPEGTWRVMDDRGGEAEALVRIAVKKGVFEGKIIKIFPRPGVDQSAICERCPGNLKDRPVLGMTILTGMTREGDGYSGGKILDPDEGDVYRCSMKLSEDGKKLLVRGYLFMPLFGRSQTWVREEGPP